MNLPNKLSLFRMILVPVLVLVYVFPYAQFHIDIPEFHFEYVSLSMVNVVALIIFCVASFTDFLDGYIARKYNLITSFGKFVDPIADKLLVNTSFILLAFSGSVPIVAVIVMIWRDTIVDGIRMMAANKGKVMAAGVLGKLKTVTQMLAIIVCFLNNLPFALFNFPMNDFLVWFATCISVLSGIAYFNQAKDILLESK